MSSGDLSRAAGSTDMGNVSLKVPSIHPMIGLDSLPAVNHQPEFTAHCATPVADRAVYDGALAMAWTTIDAALNGELCARLLRREAGASQARRDR
jgi:metal-dependent amidase/aminoacylase/carboxypeptidase family protein